MGSELLNRLNEQAWLTDSRGRACPLPIVDVALALKTHPLVELWADDPAAPADVRAFAQSTGHRLEQLEVGPVMRALLRQRVR